MTEENRPKTKEVTDKIEWRKIHHEIYRVYEFIENEIVVIDRPVLLNVSESGGHRILDANNVSHYIPAGWKHLYWETDDESGFWF